MKSTNRLIGAAVAALALAGTPCIFAQDWPQWRGPDRNDKVTGFTAPETWPKELTMKWKATVGPGDSTPALVGDKLYVFSRQGGDEVVTCLEAATGKPVWENKYAAKAVTGPAARHPGPRGSPAVAEGKVVTLGATGVLSCLDAASGKELWRNDEFPGVTPKFFTGMSPIIVDGLAIAYLGGPGDGAIMAFDAASGNLKWKWNAEGPDYGSPVVMTAGGVKQLVTLTEKSLVGIALADGKLLWQVPFPAQGMAYNAATPIVEGDTVIYAGQNRGTRAVKIEKQGEVFAAKEVWTNPAVSVQFNTPVLNDGLLFGLSDKGMFFCLDARTGKTDWVDTTKRGGSFAAILDAGSVVLAMPSTSELIAFKPSDKGYDELARIKVAETPTYAHPVIAGNRIFVKDQDTVAMWTIK